MRSAAILLPWEESPLPRGGVGEGVLCADLGRLELGHQNNCFFILLFAYRTICKGFKWLFLILFTSCTGEGLVEHLLLFC